jgi:hypothetical protein
MNLEQEIRAVLRARAAAFAPSLQPSDALLRQARLRSLRTVLTTTVLTAAALLVGIAVADRLAPEQPAFAAVNVSETGQLSAPRSHAHDRAGEPITREMVVQNVRCLRDRGFKLPDPVKTPEGWQVIVESSEPPPSESPDLNVRKRWAQAVFVDCRLMEATGDLVLGGRTRSQIESLLACARGRGFALPQPVENRPGEFVFDLDAASPAWGTDDWYKTVFVDCGLWRSAPTG